MANITMYMVAAYPSCCKVRRLDAELLKAIAVQTTVSPTIHLFCLQYDSCDKNDDCEKTECCIEESNFWIASKRDLPPPDIEIASPFGNNPKRGEIIERLVVVECWPLFEEKKRLNKL